MPAKGIAILGSGIFATEGQFLTVDIHPEIHLWFACSSTATRSYTD